MKQDKALQKVLKTPEQRELPFGFEQRVMNQIFVEAERQTRKKFAFSMALVSLVSLSIIAATLFVLHHYYSISFSLNLPHISFSSEAKSIFLFSIYIASIVMFLLGVDGFLRRLRNRME